VNFILKNGILYAWRIYSAFVDKIPPGRIIVRLFAIIPPFSPTSVSVSILYYNKVAIWLFFHIISHISPWVDKW